MRKALLLALALGACVADEGFERARRRPIVGGQAEAGYPAVGMVDLGGAACTGTLIAPRVVISAKHCLSEGMQPEDIEFRTGRLGDVSSGRGIALFYEGGLDGEGHGEGNLPDGFVNEYTDFFAMTLDRAPPIEPAPYRRTPIGQDRNRQPGFIVGYGLTAAEGGTSGEKRSGPATISAVQQNHPIIVTSRAADEATGCWGDSGGPLFSDGQVAGVMTYFENVERPCDAGGRYIQVGEFADLIDQAIRAAEQDGGEDGRRDDGGGGGREGGGREGGGREGG
ncbi:MAG: trypsin-like serine protease, partial [Deltaproteobacteria bacterium]|nr:trypsin-like serine protease [Deltaproteobacteria bacterium]